MMSPSFDLEKLRNLPIEGVARRLGLQLNNRHQALCPFHADTHPSLHFSLRLNKYCCFVCGARGNTIGLAMGVLRVGFVEACRWLANEHNIISTRWQAPALPAKYYPPDVAYLAELMYRPQLNDEARRFLFDERRIRPEVVEQCGIGSISQPTPCWRMGKPFYDAPALLIPYRDTEGRLMSVQSRYLGPDKEKPRFRFPSNSNCRIFNLPVLKGLLPTEELWITEGVTDCLAMLSSGRKAIAIPSATMLKPEDVELLRQSPSQNFHIYPDQDAAGERLFLNLRKWLPGIERHQLPEGVKDFGELWNSQNL